jgi:hypothetical protein
MMLVGISDYRLVAFCAVQLSNRLICNSCINYVNYLEEHKYEPSCPTLVSAKFGWLISIILRI